MRDKTNLVFRERLEFRTNLFIEYILPVTCTAFGDLHIYSKHILAYDQYYYIGERHTKYEW